jgi:hypothetical protein
MCTINTSKLFDAPRVIIDNNDHGVDIAASLPYAKAPPLSHTTTRYQKMKISELKSRKIDQLKRDREFYFHQLAMERLETNMVRNKAAVKIQSLFRGYRKRHGIASYVRHRKRIVIMSQNAMQDELCKMALFLSLTPISGLSLEARSKTSRRKNRIENAAAFRLQRFFRMLFARSMARKRLLVRRVEIVEKSAKTITRAIRYIKTKNFVKQCDVIKKNRSALKMQMRFRIFAARMKYVLSLFTFTACLLFIYHHLS